MTEVRDRERGLGWEDKELWNFWELNYMTSETRDFKTYQGAKDWMLLMLAGLLEPYNSTPYILVGLRMALQIANVLKGESSEDLFGN